jgi:hypothetical protein
MADRFAEQSQFASDTLTGRPGIAVSRISGNLFIDGPSNFHDSRVSVEKSSLAERALRPNRLAKHRLVSF